MVVVAFLVGLAAGASGRAALVDDEACRTWLYQVAFEARHRAEHQRRDFDDVAKGLAGAPWFLDEDAQRVERPAGCSSPRRSAPDGPGGARTLRVRRQG